MKGICILFQVIILPFLVMSPVSGQKVTTIDLGHALKQPKSIFLSEVAEKIDYIRLETTEKVIVGGGRHLLASDQNNFITADLRFLRFDSSGKYLNTISNSGKGPGEYQEIGGFEISPKTGKFFVFDRLGKVISYNLNGDFIQDRKMSVGIYSELLGPDWICSLYPSRFVAQSKGYRIVVRDEDGNTLKRLLMVDKESYQRIGELSVQNSRLYSFGDSITIWEGICDTIYRLTSKFEVITKYVIVMGKGQIPRFINLPVQSPEYRKEIDRFTMTTGLVETNRFIFFNVSDRGQYKSIVYDKKASTCISLTDQTRLQNDLDSGPSFWPQGVTFDGRLYQIIDIPVLRAMLENQVSTQPKNTEAARNFKKMLDQTSENDNPVIMLVTPRS